MTQNLGHDPLHQGSAVNHLLSFRFGNHWQCDCMDFDAAAGFSIDIEQTGNPCSDKQWIF